MPIPPLSDDHQLDSLLPDPAKPPVGTMLFQGWLKSMPDPAGGAITRYRLYSIPFANEYIEFNEADVVLFQKLKGGNPDSPSSSLVWIKEGAQIQHVTFKGDNVEVQGSFLHGTLGQFGGSGLGSAGSGSSLLCGIGGTSLLCGIGGTSLLCGVGATSFFGC